MRKLQVHHKTLEFLEETIESKREEFALEVFRVIISESNA